jgi:hypothetical protein
VLIVFVYNLPRCVFLSFLERKRYYLSLMYLRLLPYRFLSPDGTFLGHTSIAHIIHVISCVRIAGSMYMCICVYV